MKLSVADRLTLLNVLPKEGDYTTLKIVRKLRDDLSFSEEEHKILQFQKDGEMVRWNDMEDTEIDIGEKATDVIQQAFKELDKQGKLHMEYLDLYERFIKE